jgi:hypothetical protein
MEDTGLGDESKATDFMTENYDYQLFGRLNPLPAGALPFFDDPTFFDPEGSLALLDERTDK